MPINKVRVFVSSKCDNKDDIENGCNKYGVMRKSVKLLLEQTNICDVFVFEEGHSTSYNVEAAYMNHLEDSDLVITERPNGPVSDRAESLINSDQSKQQSKKGAY